MEHGGGEDLGEGRHRAGGEPETGHARSHLEPDEAVRDATPPPPGLAGGEAPHEQGERCAEDERAAGVEAVGGQVATDRYERGHDLTGQAGDHRRREPACNGEPAPHVLMEGEQQEGAREQAEREQRSRRAKGAEVAEGAGAEQVEPGDGGGDQEGGPQDRDGGHPREPERSSHVCLRRRRSLRMRSAAVADREPTATFRAGAPGLRSGDVTRGGVLMTIGPIEVARVDGGQVTLSPDDLRSLAGEPDGRLLRAGDPGWDEATLIWNAMVARQPALVFRPASMADVVAAVKFAADHGLLLTVKGGGHNIAGTSLASGALTLDMSLLRTVEVDPVAGTARVGAGCLLKHVDAATQEHGLAAVLGFVSETGVAGLTLGGGFGYLTRRFGWTVDSLEAVEIVTADGQVRTASRDEEPELFWALRGGGGNFGIATRFTFRLFQVGPAITGGLIAWSADEADEVMTMFADLTESAPRELTTALVVRLAPPAPFIPPEWHGKPIVAMVVCHSGADAKGDLRLIRGTGHPVADVIMEKPYAGQQSMLDATQPKGLNYYWKSEFLPAFSPQYRTTLLENALKLTSPLSQAVAGFHIGGALNERDEDDGAVGNRDARYVAAFSACWRPDDDRTDEHLGWARRSWEAVRPFSTGGNYVNFQVFDDDASRTTAAYGANYTRLQQAKLTYDPHNLFRVNRNVSPAG